MLVHRGKPIAKTSVILKYQGGLATKSLATRWPFWEGIGLVFDEVWRGQDNAFLLSYEKIAYILMAKMAKIPCSPEIISVLPLFGKYLAIYHLFKNCVHKTRVWHITWVLETWVL